MSSFGSSAPPPDPLLQQEEAAAKSDKISTIQDQVSTLTNNLVRLYGAKVALGGSGPNGPPTGGATATGHGGLLSLFGASQQPNPLFQQFFRPFTAPK